MGQHTGKDDSLPRYGDRRRIAVGLLGGSFNPAHAGHRHVADSAMRHLRLGQVWLLVSPGNPLKPGRGMASLADRLVSARAIADGRRVVATAIERHFASRFTLDTLRTLKRRFPRVRFVWLMGADNLTQFPRWRGWMRIAAAMPFAVLKRPTYTRPAIASQAARRLAHARQPARRATGLAHLGAPAWVLLDGPENTLSATAIRRAAEGESLSPGSPPHPPAPAATSRNAARQKFLPR